MFQNNLLFVFAIAIVLLCGCEGPEGQQGSQGPVGPAGLQGAHGANGSDGSDGQDGEDGEPGPEGPPGAAIIPISGIISIGDYAGDYIRLYHDSIDVSDVVQVYVTSDPSVYSWMFWSDYAVTSGRVSLYDPNRYLFGWHVLVLVINQEGVS
ncbi:hypothetical protein ES703_45579 [subsurface metagenome]